MTAALDPMVEQKREEEKHAEYSEMVDSTVRMVVGEDYVTFEDIDQEGDKRLLIVLAHKEFPIIQDIYERALLVIAARNEPR